MPYDVLGIIARGARRRRGPPSVDASLVARPAAESSAVAVSVVFRERRSTTRVRVPTRVSPRAPAFAILPDRFASVDAVDASTARRARTARDFASRPAPCPSLCREIGGNVTGRTGTQRSTGRSATRPLSTRKRRPPPTERQTAARARSRARWRRTRAPTRRPRRRCRRRPRNPEAVRGCDIPRIASASPSIARRRPSPHPSVVASSNARTSRTLPLPLSS